MNCCFDTKETVEKRLEGLRERIKDVEELKRGLEKESAELEVNIQQTENEISVYYKNKHTDAENQEEADRSEIHSFAYCMKVQLEKDIDNAEKLIEKGNETVEECKKTDTKEAVAKIEKNEVEMERMMKSHKTFVRYVFNDGKLEKKEVPVLAPPPPQETTEIKTNELSGSVIVGGSDTQMQKLKEWLATDKLELLYRGTKDGMSAQAFHEKCDNQGPTVMLIKNDKEHVFGGYTSIPWTSEGGYKQAPGSFLFTLTNGYNIPPTKFALNNEEDECAVHHSKKWGPCFGDGDIRISSLFTAPASIFTRFPCSYNSNGVSNSDKVIELCAAKEIEVYKITQKSDA